jgi:hypothetical protein
MLNTGSTEQLITLLKYGIDLRKNFWDFRKYLKQKSLLPPVTYSKIGIDN